jgi:ubiquinone/menaquinone biosynthesis C-methylase UbiE
MVGDTERDIYSLPVSDERDVTAIFTEVNARVKPQAPFLGLGSGPGIAEVALAKAFGIPVGSITLVDQSPQRIPSEMREDQFVQAEFLTFLNNESGEYKTVTLLACEFVFRSSESDQKKFWDALSKRVAKGGYVIVYPFPHSTTKPPNTFKQIYYDSEVLSLLVLQKK